MNKTWFEGVEDVVEDELSVLSLTLPTCFREFHRVCRGRGVLG
jgi:hypothetical protein